MFKVSRKKKGVQREASSRSRVGKRKRKKGEGEVEIEGTLSKQISKQNHAGVTQRHMEIHKP